MHISSASFLLAGAVGVVHAASVPRATAAPQLAERDICLNPSCSKTVTVTAHSTTTTTLAPASTVFVTSSTTTTSTQLSSTTVAAPCVTGAVGIYDVIESKLVAYLGATPPFTNTNGATFSNALKVKAAWLDDSSPAFDGHRRVQAISQAEEYFGFSSTSSGATSRPPLKLDVVADSSSAGIYPAGSGTSYYESNIWRFEALGTTGGMGIDGTWSAAYSNYGMWWNSDTGDIWVGHEPPPTYRAAFLEIVTTDTPVSPV